MNKHKIGKGKSKGRLKVSRTERGNSGERCLSGSWFIRVMISSLPRKALVFGRRIDAASSMETVRHWPLHGPVYEYYGIVITKST